MVPVAENGPNWSMLWLCARILVSIPIIALPFSALLGVSDTLVLED